MLSHHLLFTCTHLIGLVDKDVIICMLYLRACAMLFVVDDDDVDFGFPMVLVMAKMLIDCNPVVTYLLLVVKKN